MEVSSKITSRRGVSLPFSDFCVPLGAYEDLTPLFDAAVEFGKARKWKYLESRNDSWSPNDANSVAFHGHVIDLKQDEDALF